MGLLDRRDGGGDELPQEVLLADDGEPVRRVRARRDEARQLVDVGRATGGLQLALPTELFGERDLVDARARLVQPYGDGVDVLVLRVEEVIGSDALLEAALQGVAAVDDDARDQAALGVEIMGRDAVAVVGGGFAALALGSFGHGKKRSMGGGGPVDSAKQGGRSRLVHGLFTGAGTPENKKARSSHFAPFRGAGPITRTWRPFPCGACGPSCRRGTRALRPRGPLRRRLRSGSRRRPRTPARP